MTNHEKIHVTGIEPIQSILTKRMTTSLLKSLNTKKTHTCVCVWGGGGLQMFHGRDTNPKKGVSVGCIGHNNF